MTGTVLILGANGRFGRAATQAFAAAGWQVRAASRAGKGALVAGVSNIQCDVMDQKAVIRAAQGVDIIVHAVNPAYPDWAKLMPTHTANIIAAGLESGATVMISGNVYPFGANARVALDEKDAPAPTTRKGVMRVTMERAFQEAAAQGLRTVILRGGDFIERTNSGDWFGNYMSSKVHKGIFTYPGRMDAVHAWAYLPDMARAMVALADKRATLPAFSSFGFEGYSLTGAEVQAAAEQALGYKLKTRTFPWAIMPLIGIFSPLAREVLEMRYLWNTPHRVDGAALAAILPDFTPTPMATAFADILSQKMGSRAGMGAAQTQSA